MGVEAERRDFYVYVLFRADGVTPFYVGKGCGRRIAAHQRKASNPKTMKDRIVAKTIDAIGRVPYSIIFESLTDLEAQSAEAGLISSMGRRDIGTGVLANMTDGGDGAAGATTSDKVRAQRSERIRKLMLDPSERVKVSEINNIRFSDPVAREAIGAQSRERWADEEYRVAVGSAISAARSTPEQSARQTAINNERWSDPEARKAHSEKMRTIQTDPSIKAKQSEARKAWWARKRAEGAKCA